MEFLLDFLPIIIYILLIVLISVFIFLLLKMSKTIDKVNGLLEDVEMKLSSLDAFFNAINWTTEKINIITERIVDSVMSVVHKLFNRRKDDDYE